jgi:hypothetical protein
MEFIDNNKGSDSDQHKVFQPKLQENFNIYKLIFYQVGILSELSLTSDKRVDVGHFINERTHTLLF